MNTRRQEYLTARGWVRWSRELFFLDLACTQEGHSNHEDDQ